MFHFLWYDSVWGSQTRLFDFGCLVIAILVAICDAISSMTDLFKAVSSSSFLSFFSSHNPNLRPKYIEQSIPMQQRAQYALRLSSELYPCLIAVRQLPQSHINKRPAATTRHGYFRGQKGLCWIQHTPRRDKLHCPETRIRHKLYIPWTTETKSSRPKRTLWENGVQDTGTAIWQQ